VIGGILDAIPKEQGWGDSWTGTGGSPCSWERILLATFPLAYALAPNIFVIYAVEPVAGLTSLLGSTAYVSYLYDSSTKEDVKMSLGVYSLVQGLGAVVGSLISSAIFMGVEPILGLERGVEYLLLTSAVLRIMTSFGYLKLKV
jgi:hypothetical protein